MTQKLAMLALITGVSITGYIFGRHQGYQLGIWDAGKILEFIFDHLEEEDVYEDTEDA